MARKRKKQYEEDESFGLSQEAKQGIAIVTLFTLAILSFLSLFGAAGNLGEWISKGLLLGFGWGKWVFPLVLLIASVLIYLFGYNKYRIIGVFIFILSYSGVLNLLASRHGDSIFSLINDGTGGGYVGLPFFWPLQQFAGFWAGVVVLVAMSLISLLLIFNTSIHNILRPWLIFSWLKNLLFQKEPEEVALEVEVEKMEPQKEGGFDEESQKLLKEKGDEIRIPISTRRYSKIDLPIDLLNSSSEKPNSGNIKANQERIQKTLLNFGIPVEMGEVSVGPTVTQYTLKPQEGVKLSQITALSNDLALALAAHPIRIEAPIPGKSLVGIEVPNQAIALVTLREVIDSEEFKKRHSNLTVGFGKDVAGRSYYTDLGRMPHLLISGATGSGKSVMINSIIISLLYQNSPEELKFILIDPKRVELPIYNDIPHLLTPVITDVAKTINALKWTISEMDRRYDLLSQEGKRTIEIYNQTTSLKLPYIVLIIDELADIMAVAGREVEACIIRLAQMARATGIHLVLATQRPSVDVITGLIKANITSRTAFTVASQMDSRTILDTSGAEKLLGRGDMLYISAELSKPKRLQGAYVSEGEIHRVVKYLKEKSDLGAPQYIEEVTAKQQPEAGRPVLFSGSGSDDPLLDEARDLVIKAQKASASLLQRRLRIGYARAARLLDLLEEEGIIGPGEGAKPREVLVSITEDAENK